MSEEQNDRELAKFLRESMKTLERVSGDDGNAGGKGKGEGEED